MSVTKDSNASIADSNTFGFINSDLGLKLKSVNDLHAYKKAIPDENLTWDQVLEARSVLLRELEAVGWNSSVIDAFAAMFYNLEMHPVKRKTYRKQTLVLYQAKVCQEWHDCKDLGRPLFNIGHINDKVMAQCEEKICDKMDTMLANEQRERIAQVSDFLCLLISYEY